MSKTNTLCPFCGDDMEMEIYNHGAGKPPTMQMSCQNPNCPVKPISIESRPSIVLEDVKAMGHYNADWTKKDGDSNV